MEKLRIGLLLERYEIPKAEYEALEEVLSKPRVTLTTVGISHAARERQDGDQRGTVGRLLHDLSRNRPNVLVGVDFHIAKHLGEEAAISLDETWWNKRDVRILLQNHRPTIIEYELHPVQDGPRYEIPDAVVQEFEETVDVIINFEHSILAGDILTATRYGVLSHHGADIRRYRGRPAAYWQYLNDEPVIGTTIQQLTPRLDAGNPVLIRHSNIDDTDTLWDVKRKPKERLPRMYSDVIERILQGNFEPEPLDVVGTLTHSSDKQRWGVVLRVLAKNWGRRVRRSLRSLGN